MPPDYSKADEKVMLYMYPAIFIFILVACYFCIQYNDKQVANRLAKEGITEYCRVDSAYEVNAKGDRRCFMVLDYTRSGKNKKFEIEVGNLSMVGYDTVILRRLKDGAPDFIRLIGYRENGKDVKTAMMYDK
jgi:hypothetical protein